MAGTATFTAVPSTSIQPDSNAREETIWGTITCVAGVGNTDYAAGGLTLSFLGLVPFHSAPVEVKVWSEDVDDGFLYRYIPNASPTIANGKVAIFTGTATALPLAEHTVAALDAAVVDSADDGLLRFRAIFTKGK